MPESNVKHKLGRAVWESAQDTIAATMAAPLLQDAVADWGSWTVGRAKPGKNVNVIPLQLNGKSVYLQTALTTDAAHSWVMCNPSVFNGTGAEERKSILIANPFYQIENLRLIEVWVKKQLRSTYPVIDQIWNSAIRTADNYPPSIRANVWVGGYSPCKFYDENGQPYNAPADMAGLQVAPIVTLNAFVQSNIAGLLIETVALKIIGKKRNTHPEFSFS